MFEEFKYIIIPILALGVSQILKFIIESIKNKKICWERLFNGTGGIPSSHNAFVFSLTTIIGINEGITTPIFGISLVFSLIVMYDSMSLRMATENQAKTINKLIAEIIKKDRDKVFKILKEEIGHEPIEVLWGIILGIFIGLILG